MGSGGPIGIGNTPGTDKPPIAPATPRGEIEVRFAPYGPSTVARRLGECEKPSLAYEVQWREVPEEDPEVLPIDDPTFSSSGLLDPDSGVYRIAELEPETDYEVRVRTIDTRNKSRSEWRSFVRTTYTETELDGVEDVTRPPPPEGLRFTGLDSLSWPKQESDVIVGYEIRHASGEWGPEAWDFAEPAHSGMAFSPFSLVEVPGGARTILVKSINADGVRSLEATAFFSDGRPLYSSLLYEDIHVDLGAMGYPGTITGGTVTGTAPDEIIEADLLPGASDTHPAWWGDIANEWGDGSTLPYWVDDTVAAWTGIHEELVYQFDVDLLTPTVYPAARLTIEVASDSPNGPMRIDFQRIDVPGHPVEPWFGVVDAIDPGTYRFRVILPPGPLQSSITQVEWSLSYTLQAEVTYDLTVPSGGVRIPLQRTFFKIIEVTPTIKQPGTDPDTVIFPLDFDNVLGPLLVSRKHPNLDRDGFCDVIVWGIG